MRVDASRPWCAYPFEQKVLDTLAESGPEEGFVTGNLVIPDVEFRYLPNELDIVVLLTGYVYVIEVKELEPGSYRSGTGDRGWEFSPDGSEFHQVEGLMRRPPYDITLNKQRKMHSWMRALRTARGLPSKDDPTVIGVLAVPDHADISRLGWGPERLLKANLASLAATIIEDWQRHPKPRPSIQNLEALLGLGGPTTTSALATTSRLPCCLSPDLEVIEPLEGRVTRPIERHVYRGRLQGRLPVRVEIIPTTSLPRRRPRRAIRNYLEAFRLLRTSPAMVFLHSVHDRAGDQIVVTELFSDETLMTVVERGGPLSWSQAARVFLPVRDLLAAGHQEGLAHRYLDPSAVLLRDPRGPRPGVRVNGYYGAVVADMSAITAASSPASPFLAPEAGSAGARGNLLDAYSFGRCLRFALTGDPYGDLGLIDDPEVRTALEDLCHRTPDRRSDGWDAMSDLLRMGSR